jgi:hypothetical protein
MRPVADATVKQNPMDLSQVRCFHCNETGHMRRDCGSKVARPRPTDAVLPKYVRATVRVADPTPNIGEADPVVYGGPCSYCKNPSHVMLNCWKLAREKPELSRSIGQKPRQVRAAYVQHLADPESQDSEFNEEEGCVQTPLKQRVTTAGGCVHSPERYRPPEDDSDEGWWCNMYRAPGNTVYSIALASTGDSSHLSGTSTASTHHKQVKRAGAKSPRLSPIRIPSWLFATPQQSLQCDIPSWFFNQSVLDRRSQPGRIIPRWLFREHTPYEGHPDYPIIPRWMELNAIASPFFNRWMHRHRRSRPDPSRSQQRKRAARLRRQYNRKVRNLKAACTSVSNQRGTPFGPRLKSSSARRRWREMKRRLQLPSYSPGPAVWANLVDEVEDDECDSVSVDAPMFGSWWTRLPDQQIPVVPQDLNPFGDDGRDPLAPPTVRRSYSWPHVCQSVKSLSLDASPVLVGRYPPHRVKCAVFTPS